MDLDLELGLLLLLRPLSRRKDIEGGACRLFEPKRQLSLAPFSPSSMLEIFFEIVILISVLAVGVNIEEGETREGRMDGKLNCEIKWLKFVGQPYHM